MCEFVSELISGFIGEFLKSFKTDQTKAKHKFSEQISVSFVAYFRESPGPFKYEIWRAKDLGLGMRWAGISGPAPTCPPSPYAPHLPT